jgi:hypothetical protein
MFSVRLVKQRQTIEPTSRTAHWKVERQGDQVRFVEDVTW